MIASLNVDGSYDNGSTNDRVGLGIVLKYRGAVYRSAVAYEKGITSNKAEYLGLIHGLMFARIYLKRDVKLMVFMDSQVVVNQVSGYNKTNAKDLMPYYRAAMSAANYFKTIQFTHIPRMENKLADKLSKAL